MSDEIILVGGRRQCGVSAEIKEFLIEFYNVGFKLTHPKPDELSKEEYENYMNRMAQTYIEDFDKAKNPYTDRETTIKVLTTMRDNAIVDRAKYSKILSRELFKDNNGYESTKKIFEDLQKANEELISSYSEVIEALKNGGIE